MTSIQLRPDERLPVASDARSNVAWWGMWLFILNEATLFAALLASYFFLAVSAPAWPPAGVERPTLTLPILMTFALLSSSAVLIRADRALARGDRRAYRLGVGTTMVLGLIFLSLQAKEYVDKLQHLRPSQNSYGSAFYTITGLHGSHVAFGVLFLGWALTREVSGTARPKSMGLKNASLYWHFVDAVWLAILTSLYLSPHWT
ncbi:MAG TPA: heme-copper oxidase subunit III [Gemmatimonadaceae bacterium]|jgi:heme/copper-type cytochrome/quinol oxidase subunit 3